MKSFTEVPLLEDLEGGAGQNTSVLDYFGGREDVESPGVDVRQLKCCQPEYFSLTGLQGAVLVRLLHLHVGRPPRLGLGHVVHDLLQHVQVVGEVLRVPECLQPGCERAELVGWVAVGGEEPGETLHNLPAGLGVGPGDEVQDLVHRHQDGLRGGEVLQDRKEGEEGGGPERAGRAVLQVEQDG